MGAFLLFGLALFAFLAGMIQEDRVRNTVMRAAPASADLSGYIAYKMAVQAYVAAHPGTSGAVASSSLDLGGSTSTLSEMGNMVTPSATGTQIETWMLNSTGRLPAALAASHGDLAIGTSVGTRWQTPSGGDMGPLNVAVPAGDVVSLVTFTGTGF